MLAIIALAVKALLPQLDPDTALIYGFGELLGPGFAGLAIVLLFAAIMSSIDTYAFTTSSSIIQGFFRKLNKTVTVKAIKIVLTMLLILSTILVIVLENMVLSTYIFTGFIIVLAIPTLLTWIRKKVNPLTLIISFVVSFIGIFYLLFTAPVLDPSLVSNMLIISIAGTLFGGLVSMVVKKYKK
jgi:Na+/proline symporter